MITLDKLTSMPRTERRKLEKAEAIGCRNSMRSSTSHYLEPSVLAACHSFSPLLSSSGAVVHGLKIMFPFFCPVWCFSLELNKGTGEDDADDDDDG